MHDGLLAGRAPGSRRAIPWRILAMLLSLHVIVAAKNGRSQNVTEPGLLLPKRGAADPTSLDRLDELKLRHPAEGLPRLDDATLRHGIDAVHGAANTHFGA